MSEQDLELERLRRAFAAREDTASASACPEAQRIWSAVHGELPPEEVRPLVAHLALCPACAEAWRLAREVDGATLGGAGMSGTPGRRNWGRWAALAAGLAAIALASVLLIQRPASSPEFREAEAGPAGQIRSLLDEARPLPRSRFLLRWTPGLPNVTYAVQVVTERLEPIAEARGLSATEYLVPPEKLASVGGGAKLLWRVEAMAPDGARAGSATFVSRLE